MTYKIPRRTWLCFALAAAAGSGAISHPAYAHTSPALLRFILAPTLHPYAEQSAPGRKADTPLPEGPGKETTQRICSGCHSTDVWSKQRHTPEKWSSIVDNMISKGMEASDDDLAVVTDYLSKNFAPAPTTKPPDPPPAK